MANGIGAKGLLDENYGVPSPVILDWAANTQYQAQQAVLYGGVLYRSKAAFISGSVFSAANWDLVSNGAYAPRRSVKSPGVWKQSVTTGGTRYIGSDTTAGVTFWANTTNIFISTDFGVTVSTGKGLPTGVTDGFSVLRIVRFGSSWVCIAKDASDSNKYKVFSATVATGNTALTWAANFTLATNATSISGAIAAAPDGSALLVTEYSGTPNITGGPSIYRTTDLVTFTSVGQQAGVRHAHGVWFDPYATGVAYWLLGDGTTTPLFKSTDGGATWAVVSSVGVGWDGVQMSFSPNYIWLTGDTVNSANVAPFYVLDRATLTPQVGCINSPKSTAVVNPGVFSNGSVTSGTNVLTMSSIENPLTTDDIGKALVVKKTSDATLLVPSGTTIVDVVGVSVTMSNAATATSTAATYIVNRNERYYPQALYGTVDAANEAFYLHADNIGPGITGLPYRYGLFVCRDVFGPLEWLDNVPQASVLAEVVSGNVLTGVTHRPTITASTAV